MSDIERKTIQVQVQTTTPIDPLPTSIDWSDRNTVIVGLTGDTETISAIWQITKASGIHQVRKNIFNAILKLVSATVAVRLFSLVSQVLISSRFGAGAVMDGFFATQLLPTVMAYLVISSIEVAVIPTFINIFAKGVTEDSHKTYSTILNALILTTGAVLIGTILAENILVRLSAPEISQEGFNVAVLIAPIVFPIFLLNVLIGYLRAILNAAEKFGFSAFAEAAIPILMGISTFLIVPNVAGIAVLAIGMTVGTFVQMALLFAQVRNLGLRYRFALNWRLPVLREIVVLGIPVFFGALLVQANPLVDQIVGSTLGPGVISAENYALKIIGVINTLLFLTLSRAVFPYFSKQAESDNIPALKRTFRFYLWAMWIVTSIVGVVAFAAAPLIITIIFRHGNFTTGQAAITASMLRGFAIGLPATGYVFLAGRVFYAIKRSDIQFWLSPIGLVINVVMDIFLARVMGPMGIAVSTSLVYLGIGLFEYYMMRRIMGSFDMLAFPSFERLSASPYIRPFARFVENWRTGAWAESLRNPLLRVGIMLATFVGIGVEVVLGKERALRLTIGAALAFVFARYPIIPFFLWGMLCIADSVTVGNQTIAGTLSTISLPTFAVLLVVYGYSALRRHPAMAPLVLFLAWAGFSLLHSASRSAYIQDMTPLVAALGLMTIATRLTNRDQIEQFINVILVIAVGVAVSAIIQYQFRLGGFIDGTSYRVQSLFSWSNGLGFYLVITILLTFYRAYMRQTSYRLWWTIALALQVVALSYTFSRESEIATIAGIGVMCFLRGGRMRIGFIAVFIASGIGVALATVLGLHVLGRFADASLLDLNGRLAFWEQLLANFNWTHLTGNGVGSANALIGSQTSGFLASPHNVYLEELYDTGLPGAVFFILALLMPLIAVLRRYRDHRGMRALVGGMIIAVMLYSIADSTLLEFKSALFWIIISLPFTPAFAQVAAPAAQMEAPAAGDEPETLVLPRAERKAMRAQARPTPRGT
jgi:putative peptidoglycan lipid II flippase